MCGRYASTIPIEQMARLFRTTNPLPNCAPNWNTCPTQDAVVVRRHPESGERHLNLLKWGLLPSWTKEPTKAHRPINARCETIGASGMFRGAFKARRCIVPADAFYEWQATENGKQPYAIARQDGQPMAFAGLWEAFKWPDETIVRTYAIVTTAANDDVAELHDRMPVILEQDDWDIWLGADADVADLLRPSPPGTLRTWPVSKRVNTPRDNDANLLEPLAPGAADDPMSLSL
jgi:putative SOS response-associated peptidase YedK